MGLTTKEATAALTLLIAARRQAFYLNYDEYRSSHGAMPRGRGSWAFVFRVGIAERITDYPTDSIFWAPGSITFAEAKKVARAEAKRRFPEAAAVTALVCS